MNLNERLPLLLPHPADLGNHIVAVNAIARRQVLPGGGLEQCRVPGTRVIGTVLGALGHVAHRRHAENRLGAALVAPLYQLGATQRTGRQFTGVHFQFLIVQWVRGFHGVLLFWLGTVCHKNPPCQVNAFFLSDPYISFGGVV